ncbi:MAG TPA: hypothetical protein VFC15_12925 [Candidatus Limnocylindrales bacterium]|nr:hypothetical protein [Candidatus Limnocylindrales bacterium]
MKKISTSSAVAVFSILLLTAQARDVGPKNQIGELEISPTGVQITTTSGRSKATAGFHYVRFGLKVKNIGNYAICAMLSADLQNTLNVGGGDGVIEFKAKNPAEVARGSSIRQLLPGEELVGSIVFSDLRDGVEPVTLTIDGGTNQGCSREDPESIEIRDQRVSFAVSEIPRESSARDAQTGWPEAVAGIKNSFVSCYARERGIQHDGEIIGKISWPLALFTKRLT